MIQGTTDSSEYQLLSVNLSHEMQFLNISLKLILLQQKRKKEKKNMNKKEQAFSWDYSSVASEYWGRGEGELNLQWTRNQSSAHCSQSRS